MGARRGPKGLNPKTDTPSLEPGTRNLELRTWVDCCVRMCQELSCFSSGATSHCRTRIRLPDPCPARHVDLDRHARSLSCTSHCRTRIRLSIWIRLSVCAVSRSQDMYLGCRWTCLPAWWPHCLLPRCLHVCSLSLQVTRTLACLDLTRNNIEEV